MDKMVVDGTVVFSLDKAILDGTVEYLREGEEYKFTSHQEDAHCCAQVDFKDYSNFWLIDACEVKVGTFDKDEPIQYSHISFDKDSQKCLKGSKSF